LRLHRRFVIETDKDLTSPDLPLWQEPVDLIRYLLLVSLAFVSMTLHGEPPLLTKVGDLQKSLTLRQHRLSV
jgi:hypothetical protein